MQEEAEKNNLPKNTPLAWACRRGMLELDVLLMNFLKEAYPTLTPEHKTLFESLLHCTDPELFAWLMGRSRPADEGLAMISDIIRQHAKSRF